MNSQRSGLLPVAFIAVLLLAAPLLSQVSPWQNEIFWKLSGPQAIAWDTRFETRLPHADNIEMSGQRIAVIVSYEVDTNRHVRVTRDVIFPQLVRYLNAGESTWQRYRAYLRGSYEDDILPAMSIGNQGLVPGPLDSVRIDGTLTFFHAPQLGIRIRRTLLPSMSARAFCETLTFTNTTDSSVVLAIGFANRLEQQDGVKGTYTRRIKTDGDPEVVLSPAESYTFGVYITATLDDEPLPSISWRDALNEREEFLHIMRSNLVLESPDPILNSLFLFSKIRAAESIYDTPMGLVHSPGGGRYYTGVWANDQCEYSGPFFPYLGYTIGNTAAVNAYRQFSRNIPAGDGHFWSSYEMGGDLTCCGDDRGDAAMIAYGASQFALSYGDRKTAEELWPLIEWSLGYCERQKNEAGVIRSDTDEMEGRIATGTANLSTSSLTYGALLLASDLSDALGKDPGISRSYRAQANDLAGSIETTFGATVDGLETYRYFVGHTHLRHWICLPLVMGIEDRKTGTLDALFSKLWTPNGVRVEANPELDEPDLFWDRGTLYAFRGAFRAGAADRGLERLRSYSATRLLGFHAPYVVEAWPEGNMAHLSAESALYCRIFTEGILGMTPTSLTGFDLRPRLPSDWETIVLRNVCTNGKTYDIDVRRAGGQLTVTIRSGEHQILSRQIREGDTLHVTVNEGHQ